MDPKVNTNNKRVFIPRLVECEALKYTLGIGRIARWQGSPYNLLCSGTLERLH
jgi:hypothetical protein